MYNIIAINKSSKKELICENFVEKKNKESVLQYWKTQGMSNCTYKAMKTFDQFSHNIVNKEKRDCKH